MRTRSTFILSLLASAFWLTACVGADIDGGEGGGTSKELLQVEIPTGVIPLQITESIDTKPNKLKSALASAPTDSLAPTTKAAQAVTDTAALSAPSASSASPATRADDPVVYTRAIVLQYDAVNGTLLNAGNTNIDGYTIGSSISTLLQESANCNIYVLAVNETSTSGADTQFKTETAFKEATYALYTKFPTPTDADIPLLGSLKGIRINRMETGGVEKGMISTSDGNSVKAELRRIAAKLVVNFTYEAKGFKTGTNVTIADYPTYFTLVEGEGNFPDPATPNFTNKEFKIQDTDGDTNNGTTSFTLYVPDNRRGEVVDVIRPTQKTVDYAPAKSTYLTFTATQKTNAKHQLTYRFYFGGNTTNDFNIKRNSVYTLNSAISQTAESDPRVSEGGLMPIVKVDPQVTNVSDTKATLKFKVTRYDATVSAVKVRLRASTTSSFTDYSVTPIIDQPVAEYTYNAAALSPNTVYYYSASITATVGGTFNTLIYGDTLSFSTNTAGMPVFTKEVALVSATNGLSASATGNAVTGTGITAKGIVYSTNPDFNHLKEGTRQTANNGTTDASFGVTLSGLALGTTYYYRYYAINAQGVTYSSSTLSFRTNDTPAVPINGNLESTVVNTLTFSATLPPKKNEADTDPTAAGIRCWIQDNKPTDPTDPKSAYTLSFTNPSIPEAKTYAWNISTTSTYVNKKFWYVFYSTNAAGTVCTEPVDFQSSALLTTSASATTIGPQEVPDAITFTTNRAVKATVDGTVITVGTGDGTTSVKVNMLANTTSGYTTTRTSDVILTTENELPIRSSTTKITQYGVRYPTSFSNVTGVTKDGKSATSVPVLSNIPWQASSDQQWCTIENGEQTGTNSSPGSTLYFKYTVAKNEDEAREATITVKGVGAFEKDYTRTFKVSQKGAGSSTTLTPQDPTENAGQDVNFGPPAS